MGLLKKRKKWSGVKKLHLTRSAASVCSESQLLAAPTLARFFNLLAVLITTVRGDTAKMGTEIGLYKHQQDHKLARWFSLLGIIVRKSPNLVSGPSRSFARWKLGVGNKEAGGKRRPAALQ